MYTLYYDTQCGGCQKMANFLKKYSTIPYKYATIQDSKFSCFTKETIVLESDTGDQFTHGRALKILFTGFGYPLKFLSFAPEIFHDQVYVALKYLRRFL